MSILESIYVAIFFEFLALGIAYILVKIEKEKPKGEGLGFEKLNIELPLLGKVPGFHVAAGILALIILISLVIMAWTGMTTAMVWNLIIVVILPFISLILLEIIHQGIIWNMINPSPKFGAKNLWNNYKESGEIPKIAFLALLSCIIAIAIGIVTEWLVVFIVMMIITGITVMWRVEKEKNEAVSTV